MNQLLVLTLPPYLLQKLQDKAGCLYVETASSSQPVNWGWIDLFSTIFVLDWVVSCNNQIDQTSWLMWIMGSSASLLFPAVSTTYLVISGFKITSSIQPKFPIRKQNTFWRPQPEVCFSAWQVGLLPARSWLWPKLFPTKTIFFNLTVREPVYVSPDTD